MADAGICWLLLMQGLQGAHAFDVRLVVSHDSAEGALKFAPPRHRRLPDKPKRAHRTICVTQDATARVHTALRRG